jgi:hypothetical protein
MLNFIICCVLQIHEYCDFIEWVDPKMCAHS